MNATATGERGPLTPAEWVRLWNAAGNSDGILGAAADEFNRILPHRMAIAWEDGFAAATEAAGECCGCNTYNYDDYYDNPFEKKEV